MVGWLAVAWSAIGSGGGRAGGCGWRSRGHGTAALPGRFGGAEQPLALEEPFGVLAAARCGPVAWSGLLRGRFAGADIGRTGGWWGCRVGAAAPSRVAGLW